MALTTINGLSPASSTGAYPVGNVGVFEYASGYSFTGDDLTKDFKDAQAAPALSLPSGILAGGTCTSSGVLVNVSAGIYYYATSVWWGQTDTSITVTDNATTYIWGCSDGNLRITSTTAPPLGFTRSQACLIVKCTATSGVVVFDYTAQDIAQTVDNTNRTLTANSSHIGYGWISEQDTLPATSTVTIPAGYQSALFGAVVINGVLIVGGRLRITD